ncbi:MAG: acyltransferase 3, partial [Actinomycetia bacterium]|nr:acyltransferase 3 [Actinomycetes bacterium]
SAADGFEPKTLVVGDSVAFTISRILFPEAASLKLQGGDWTLNGCGLTPVATAVLEGVPRPLDVLCRNIDQQWTDATARIKPDVTVALFSIWDEIDQQINGHWYRFGTAKDDAYLSGRLDRMIAIVSARGGKVLLLTAPYTKRTESADTGRKWESDDPKRVDHMNQLIRAAVARHPGVAQIGDLNKLLAPKGVYQETVNGKAWNYDGVHFNDYGGQVVSKWVAQQVHKIVVPPVTTTAPPKN